MAEQSTIEHIRYRIRRDASGVVAWFRNSWQSSRRFRWLAGTLGLGLVLAVLLWTVLAWDLPDAENLADYETPLPTVVRGIDGEIVHSYARERRVQL